MRFTCLSMALMLDSYSVVSWFCFHDDHDRASVVFDDNIRDCQILEVVLTSRNSCVIVVLTCKCNLTMGETIPRLRSRTPVVQAGGVLDITKIIIGKSDSHYDTSDTPSFLVVTT